MLQLRFKRLLKQIPMKDTNNFIDDFKSKKGKLNFIGRMIRITMIRIKITDTVGAGI